MDEERAADLLAQLIAWGLVEERADGEIAPTRRWNAQVQASAERLNQEVERTGTYPEGNPLVLAIASAFHEARPDVADSALRDDLVRMLVTLELSRMTPEKRARYGF